MRRILLLCLCLGLGGATRAAIVDLKQKTLSRSGQFTIYSTNPSLRFQVATFADDLRDKLSRLLGVAERRGTGNTVIIFEEPSGETSALSAANVSLTQVEGGFKIDIRVRLGKDPATINLQKQIVKAFFLEEAYRDRPETVKGGEATAEAPWWLVEGVMGIFQRAEEGADADFFRQIVEANKLPALTDFLKERPEGIGGPATAAMDRACAACFVQSLLDQPNGRVNLTRFVQRLGDGGKDSLTGLQREFPEFKNLEDVRKWWTLSLARYSAADRYAGLSPQETEAQLATLLRFKVGLGKVDGKLDETKEFELGQFEEFRKLPGCKAALSAEQGRLVALSATANALYRPIISEYSEVVSLLLRGKTRRVKERLARTDEYRKAILSRKTDVADYLNWFEATKMATKDGELEGCLEAARELSTPTRRDDPVARYMDELVAENLSTR